MLVKNINKYFLMFLETCSLEDRADLLGDAALSADNLAHIGLGYLQAAMIYSSVFDKELPETAETNGNSAATAKSLREIAKKYCGN